MHRLLKLLVVIAVLAILGPPALAFMAVLLGITIGLFAVALKVGVIVLGVWAAVMILKAIFGSSPAPRAMPRPVATRDSAIDDAFDEMKRREDEQMAALDRELARATRSTV